MTQAATLAQLASSGALSADTSGNVTAGGTMTATNLFGQSQTWTNFTVGTQRALSTTYTNSTTRPIQITVYLTSTSDCGMNITVGGVTVFVARSNVANGGVIGTITVPAGSTYSVAGTGGTITLQTWSELR